MKYITAIKRVLIDLIIFFTLAIGLRIMAGNLFLAGLNSFNATVFVYVYMFATLWAMIMSIRAAWYFSGLVGDLIKDAFQMNIPSRKGKRNGS